jgi:protein-disulfide isomerase-like protein with CxxC motif
MTEQEEKAYIEGRNAARRSMMLECARDLGVFAGKDPLIKLAHLVDEQARVKYQLRQLCERLGCNDWPDDLDLADVVEKYLARHLDT